ncbi:sensor domain-containing phosphodiesterase [Anaerofustis stercorihominis]|uniref:sensor domain-containing phosphodiesterase n=1 Tax=Anaerofustis stercorihominis TaxID=214853 RepID=UPI00214C37D0|nr:bifunctional diguanylate cyclase/phosphodiesterase [Anaerofustis stercorihominis]MCR2033641.1 bifunctional diguanylate cyclase/phosphodiesterase [Anaerofustis stercorihominis]
MKYEEICSLILNEMDNLIYISDMDKFELIYMNETAKEKFNIDKKEIYQGQKCYKVLQGLDSPCPFCTNNLINEESFYTWETYNPLLKEYFIVRDKIIDVDGKKARLEIATDITQKESEKRKLEYELYKEETIVKCIQTLSSDGNTKEAINKLLEIVCGFYEGNRAYIFEIDYENKVFSNSYEYCTKDVTKEIDNLQKLPISLIDDWITQFNNEGEFYISALDKKYDKSSPAYKILSDQGIESLIAAPLIKDGQITGFLGVDDPKKNINDLTLIKTLTYFIMNDIDKGKLLQTLNKMSYYDALTNLGNRNHYINVIEHFNENPPENIGIVYIDVNGLKLVNDNYGHDYGDVLLKQTAELLKKVYDKHVFRVGGDEFVALCPNTEKHEFDKTVAKLRKLLKNEEEINISIGAVWDEGTNELEKLIKNADNLMYLEKQSYYKSNLVKEHNYRSEVSKKLIREIADNKFTILLQPQIETSTGRISGAEALVRKIDDDGSLITPDKFISSYEAKNIIRHVDLFVLESVCKILDKWRSEKRPFIAISINISRVTVMEYKIIDKICSICDHYDIPHSLINIEVTESISKMSDAVLFEKIKRFRKEGFTISLDDFGSDYSNLSILTKIEFDNLKIDKSIIDNINSNPNARIIIEHVIDMCKHIEKTKTVAEGVETKEQFDMLENYKCDYIQGYYFSKPLTVEEFENKYMN